MEHPVREIPAVITTLTTGSPQQQLDTLNQYFLPDAAFSHPLCHVPSFPAKTIPFLPNTSSLWVLLCIYRWYRILSPDIDITVHSAVFDQRAAKLYVDIHQTFRIWFVPFYSAPVRLVTVLHLQQRTAWPAAETVADQDAESAAPLVESREPAAASSNNNNATGSGSGSGSTDPGLERARYFIAKQEDFYQANDFLQFLLPRLGPFLWLPWQLVSTGLCVVGAVVFLPVYYLLNGGKTAKKVA
ncbi:hypothetical protein AAL_06522 [Moelleriella libera RCEF 2490]|uniref:SigF-like NTF2-like domain-containing protein n=1 Tax=Moelleriella libera RCEF 2490 TaxID=1081109 RepID=A0A167YUA4_9HYPO|nr:hypothetical protein AAL_06522 [Moelleriella libera RCEF 2490]